MHLHVAGPALRVAARLLAAAPVCARSLKDRSPPIEEVNVSGNLRMFCRNDTAWVVARLGAYMHYAVPRMLHKAGRLERLYTDLYAGKLCSGLLRWLPHSWRPSVIRRLQGRVASELPLVRIRHYPALGLEYYVRRALARDWETESAVYLWAGAEFGNRVTRDGFGEAGAVYTFNTAALEILRAAKERGLFTVVEQTIAPRAMEEELLEEEEARFPGWDAKPRHRGAFTRATIERERQEWDLADMITCGSQFVKDGVARCGGPAERCVVVPYGVDATFSRLSREPRGGPLRVLTVGEAGLRKGISYASELAGQLQGKAEFRWVGPINLTAEARDQVAKQVQITGGVPRSQILPHYAWADVFFLPSVCEGSATVIYEALQSGLPVVTTPNAGSLVTDGVDGFIVPVRDTDAMKQRLLALHEDRGLLQRLKDATKDTGPATSLDAYQDRLLRALSGGRTRPQPPSDLNPIASNWNLKS